MGSQLSDELTQIEEKQKSLIQSYQQKKIDLLKKQLLPIELLENQAIKSVADESALKIIKDELNENGYQDVKLIGRGIQALVVIAKQKLSSQRYAFKCYHIKNQEGKQFQKEEESYKHFLKEVEILEECKGSFHVVNIIDHFEIKQYGYIVLQECVDTLQNLMAQNQHKSLSSEMSVIKFSKDIAEGMEYVHKRGFTVSDIKPENILIDCSGNALISDFGLSSKLNQNKSTALSDYKGNLKYCAPECLPEGDLRQKSSIRSDAFSLGQIMRDLIYGEKGYFDSIGKSIQLGVYSFQDTRYQKQLKEIIDGLTEYEQNKRKTVLEVLLTLKGIISLEFDLEKQFHVTATTTEMQKIKEKLQKKVEFIQITKNICYPLRYAFKQT